ncbi:hypothetical protein ACJIZ3_007400 [Penstemon smallii]|uniref:Xylanase inhibitor C-terminal domain-containing protein n=1 Tax=Penstemon smallii TaxID=265156 RepID=A0ABD3SAF6_9LAMI
MLVLFLFVFLFLFLVVFGRSERDIVSKSIGFSLNVVRTTLDDKFSDFYFSNRSPPNFIFSSNEKLGTPSVERKFLLDTNSFLICTQCIPCIDCTFNQASPPFDPKRSIGGGPNSNGQLCYGMRREFKKYPEMVLHFQGANYKIGPPNLFRFMKDRFCLALSMRSKGYVLGAHQMQNMRFVYDSGNGQLLFGREDCSKDKL